jgi:hypothetical protein
MKSIIQILGFSVLSFIILHAQEKEISLSEIYETNTFSGKGVPGFNFTKDGLYFSRQMGSRIVKFEMKSGHEVSTVFLRI